MKISFVGDICLGRYLREKYESGDFQLVSKEVIEKLTGINGIVIANLESPVSDAFENQNTRFCGNPSMLEQFKWIDCFSLANNHINDFGERAITDTIASLERYNFSYNGVFEEEYKPYIFEQDDCRIAIVTCTDHLNREIIDNSKYLVLRVNDPKLNQIISNLSAEGYFVIVFAHCGSMFSRIPNPQIKTILHTYIDAGAKCVVTSHSHCLGGIDKYKNVPIFYSLGDFLMDGASYRRRRACILTLNISNNIIKNYIVTPTVTTKDLMTVLPCEKERKSIMHDFEKTSKMMQKERHSYEKFYKYQYKKEMMSHSLSTLHFLYDTNGIIDFFNILKNRFNAVYSMVQRMIFGRLRSRRR